MAEVSRSRLALDLEEIERQLRHSSQQPGSSRSDPLAELARIVGQDDPFGALLAGDKGASRGSGSGDLFARREPLFDDSGQARSASTSPGLRGSLAGEESLAHAYQDHRVALTAEEEALLHGHTDPRYSTAPHEADMYYQDGPSYAEPESTFVPVQPRSSRKGMIAIGAIIGAAVLGTAGALTLRPGSLTGPSGEPPVVKAETGPSKVAPVNPGGVDIPNQNKQIYERASQDTQTRVVNREEQPVDVRQATRTGAQDGVAGAGQARLSPIVPPGNGAPSALQGSSSSTAGVLGEPRRVRTVSIKPDGTIVMPEQGGTARPAAPALIPASPPSAATPRADALSIPTPAPGMGGTTAAGPQASQGKTAPPQRPRDVTSTPAGPRTGTGATDQTAGAPLQITSDAQRPKADTRTAAAPQAILREPTETSAAPTTSPGFSVQLGVRNTEREGRAMFEQLQQRFASDLSGFSPSLRQAEINGKTAYRVRVGPMSRDDAASLCTRLKASGGQCFVANN